MEILIILIAWFSIGFIYLINLCGSKEIDKLSKKAIITILIIFLPTTIFIYIISGIEELVKRYKHGKNNKKMKPRWNECYGLQGLYKMPFCPNCNEPLYEPEKCVFCGQEIEVKE